MRGTAYYCTVEELQERGRDNIPEILWKDEEQV